MRILCQLWFCLLVPSVFAAFTSTKGVTSPCNRWSCIRQNLGLSETSTRDNYRDVLKSLLPTGPWQDVVENVLAACYGSVPKKYSRMCPEQGFLHCAAQNLIDNCPIENLRKDDVCSTVASFVSLRYMFSQSRYENLEIDLPRDRRPEYFLRNYFNKNCCNLPEIFNSTVLTACGFSTFMHYYTHQLRTDDKVYSKTTARINGKQIAEVTTKNNYEFRNVLTHDPVGCCDISEFIPPSLRSECDFRLSWEDSRLNIRNATVTTTVPPTTTTKPYNKIDIKIVPLSCEKETCVFQKLNIVSESGVVDLDAFSKLLDNMTDTHPNWSKAKARVITKCLRNPIKRAHYEGCEINKILACTFDVLSENCPFTKKDDPCKHVTRLEKDIVCQISSSKYAQNRRQFCDVPSLVHHHNPQVLSECGVSSIGRLEYVVQPVVTRKPGWMDSKNSCKEMTDSTKCLLNKMGILNKYGYMDYFGMKDNIRRFTNGSDEWSPLTEVFMAAFTSTPMYSEHCYTPRRILNVVDAMLMTCPLSKRKASLECNRFFSDIADARKSKDQVKQISHTHRGKNMPRCVYATFLVISTFSTSSYYFS